MKRSEISSCYKWDLDAIYKTEDEFNKEYNEILEKIKSISNYKETFLNSANDLYNFMKDTEYISLRLDKLYSYAHMHYDEDTSNTKYQEFDGRVKDLIDKYAVTMAGSDSIILKNYDQILKYTEEDERLVYFKKEFDDIYRFKDHILSEEEEQILSSLSRALFNGEETYSYLTDTDMKFGNIIDEDGNEVELTESNYPVYRISSDRRVRKDVFKQLLSTYGNYKNTLASTLSGHINSLCKLAKINKFSSSMEASLFNEEIDVKVYNNLIDNISKNLDCLYKYFDLKKEILGVSELHLYDTYAKVVDDFKKKYSFEEAKEMVIEATKPLGEEYTKNLKRAFDEKWIDVYPNECKKGGAYSGGSYLTYPYLLLNYEGMYDDVSTLAHELGHSMHSYFTRTNNPPITGDYKIFVAEVASLVNEVLLSKYMIKNCKDKNEKLAIINNLLDLYKATIFRQVMFAEFEKDINSYVEDDGVLTQEWLCNRYYDLNKKYYGDRVVVDDEIKYEWMRVPHFYYDFYVYKYAIGLCCASRIVDNILSGKEGSLDKYINFLSSGCRKSPLELLKDTDCDLTSNEVIDSAIKIFKDLVLEFEKTYNES